MPRDQELRRFAELLQAFAELAASRDDVQVRGCAEPPPAGFAARLQPEPTSPGGELFLWLDGGRLSTWSGDGQHPLNGHDDRLLQLDLRAGYGWETLVFPDAEQLARTLFRFMQREIDGAGRRERAEAR